MEQDATKLTVNCDSCDNSDYDTRANLEAAGWQITEQLELCPVCNFG